MYNIQYVSYIVVWIGGHSRRSDPLSEVPYLSKFQCGAVTL